MPMSQDLLQRCFIGSLLVVTSAYVAVQIHGKPDSWKNMEKRQEDAAAKL
jgi:hypothetical protein